jgi:uncharacterized membrane protein YgcG
MRMAAAALLCATAGWGADWKALKPQGYVSDFTGAVDSASRAELNAYGAALEKSTGAHLSLVLIGSLQKEPIDAVARTIFQAWSSGASAPDDRALLLIAVDDRRDSLVAGRALQTILNADASAAVLSETRPALARKQYGEALMAAADEIGSRIAAARGKNVSVHLPRRARRTLRDSIPWPLAAGAIPLLALLTWLLLRPHHRRPPEEHA